MAILSLGEIPALKELLLPYGYGLHLHDACGGQAFSLEALTSSPEEGAFPVLEEFFAARRMTLHYFGEDRLNFIVK
ncbi:MAG: hypothetical protein RSC76_06460 [Oscillospiraceae bacterium]